MKRILLGISIYFAAVVGGFAQHTQTATGFSNTCDEVGTLATDGFHFFITPTDGGFDNAKVDTLKMGYYVPAGGNLYYVLELNNTVDLTAPNNQLSFSVSCTGQNDADTSFTTTMKFEDATTTVSSVESFAVAKAYSSHLLTFTASPSLASVKKVTITLNNSAATSRVGAIYLTKIKAGSSITTATKDVTANIASSKLYPNPVSDMARVELNLKSSSSVKVVVSDLMGKEVMTVAEGTYSELSKEFSVAGLNKGMYSVNYFVDGAAAKAEMLMVK